MRIPHVVNEYRRRIMKGLTRNLGSTKFKKNTDATSFKRILISRPNKRLGNLLLLTPLLQEIEATFPNAKVDLFVRGGLAPIVFQEYHSIDKIIELPGKPFKQLFNYIGVWTRIPSKKYDLVINLQPDSSSGRLSTIFARSDNKFFGNPDVDEIFTSHAAQLPVYHLRKFLENVGIQPLSTPISPLDLKLTNEEKSQGKKVLDSQFDNDKPVIGVFTFATGSKMLSKEFWNEAYDKMVKTYPEYNIFEILPAENHSQLDFKIPTYYSRDIREIAALMSHLKIFVGADSGIMHLASAAKIPVFGLFHVTNVNKYRPYNEKSWGIDINEVPMDEWILQMKSVMNPTDDLKSNTLDS